MTDIEQHDSEWNDRLQDLLDGDLDSAGRAVLEQHIAGCARCRAQFAALKKLDGVLRAKVLAPPLARSFDQQVYARIHALDDQARERARRRMDRELEEGLESLSRAWRRGLLSTFAGAVGGIALAFALLGWFDQTGIAGVLIGAAAQEVGTSHLGTLQAFVTLALGAGIGGIVSRWLISTVE